MPPPPSTSQVNPEVQAAVQASDAPLSSPPLALCGGSGQMPRVPALDVELPGSGGDLLVEALEQHRSAYPASALVFTSPEGNQVRSGNLRRRHWAPAVARAGLDGFTFHDMSHTAVSLWVAAGASDLGGGEVGRTQLGGLHQELRYAHLFPEHDEALADRLEAFIAASTPTPAARWCTSADPDVHQAG